MLRLFLDEFWILMYRQITLEQTEQIIALLKVAVRACSRYLRVTKSVLPVLQTNSFEDGTVFLSISGNTEGLNCFPYLDNQLLDFSCELSNILAVKL